MTTPAQVREWLRKMQYPDPNPSDEALQTLCRGPMGPIFQQIIDRVKPRQEVEHTRNAIIVNKLLENHKIKLNFNKNHSDIEKLKLYYEKCELEKQLQKINAQNIEDEASLQHLKAKNKSKNANYQLNKEKLNELEKDIVLYRANMDYLEEQKEVCTKLYEQSNILETNNPIDKEQIPQKTTEVLSKLHEIISSFKPQFNPSNLDLTTISENSIAGPLQTSMILSSNKKPLSAIKRSKRANSTRENLFEITNNPTFISSTLRKKNTSKTSYKTSFIPSFNSTLSSTAKSFGDKSEAVKDLEQSCLGNQSLMNMINKLWEANREDVFRLLLDLKTRDKIKITELIAQNNIGTENYNLKTACGMEKLYAFHVETEMKRLICEQEQKKIQNMMNNINFDDIPSVTVLKATEHSLQCTIEHTRKSIKKLQQDLPDNSDKLDKILENVQKTETEIETVRSKIETHLNILKECNSWMNKQQKNILDSVRKPQNYSEYELLKSNIAEQEVKNFVACPIQAQKTHYLESWVKIYNNPELLEIIQCPFLTPENAVRFFLKRKNWLHQLQKLKSEYPDEQLSEKLSFLNIVYDEKQLNDSYQQSIQQLKTSAFFCGEISKRLRDLDTEMKYYLESPLNDCLAPNLKYKDKTLKEYCEMYDSYYLQLL